MNITFILPCVGRQPGRKYLRSWRMEPLHIARLSALTPASHHISFFDDRIEEINFEKPTDLVALSVETFTAKRAYQIAAKYHEKNIPVVMGGFHPTLIPEEVKQHATSIVLGEAENIWGQLLEDAENNQLQQVYQCNSPTTLAKMDYHRLVYQDKKYLPVSLIEFGRGCRFNCDFCAISSFYQQRYQTRPVDEVIEEINTLPAWNQLFFTDDNLGNNRSEFISLLEKLATLPRKRRWSCQLSMDVAANKEICSLLKKAGCSVVLIGFESLKSENLKVMKKSPNLNSDNREAALSNLRANGIGLYATFVFGYDADTHEDLITARRLCEKHGAIFMACNPLIPFPGTPLYERLKKEDRLLYPAWWLSDDFRVGDVPFQPNNFSAEELARACFNRRQEFFGLSSQLRRAWNNPAANLATPMKALSFFGLNTLSYFDAYRRRDLLLGKETVA